MVYQDFNSSPDANASTHSGFRIAPVIDRFLAFVFDIVLFTPVFGFILANLFRKLEMMYFTSPNSLEFLIFLLVLVIFSFFLCILFQTLFLMLMGATPGKYFFKVQIVSIQKGQKRLRFSQAWLRSSLWSLQILCFGLPFLEVVSEALRRPLHDRAAGTIAVTLKKQGDQGPHQLETQFVRQFLMVISLCLFVWGIFFVGHFYKMATKGEFKKNELEKDEYLCATVSQSLEEDQSRIDKALALFLADEIGEDCLAAEADFVLWTPNESEKSWAYLAKGILKKYDAELFEAYLDKVCEIDEDGEACEIAKFEADANQPIPQQSETAMILNVIQNFEKGRYAQAETGFAKLALKNGFESFAQAGLVKSLWAQNKLERSKGAYQNVVHQLSRSHQMELAAWVCHEELDRSCSAEAIEACEDLKTSFKAGKSPVQESFIALALIREKECRKTDAIQFMQFQAIFRERKDVSDYVRAISSESDLNVEQKHQILENLAFRKEAVRPVYLRRLALQQWVESAKTEDDFKKVTQFLKEKKIQDLSWVKIYERAMTVFVRLRAEKSIREIVHLPSEEVITAHQLKPLQVKGHYLAKQYDKAWSELQTLQSASRAPASSDSLTLDFIRQALGKQKQGQP
jgi:uncharacterized RDD family membrane protein YckC